MTLSALILAKCINKEFHIYRRRASLEARPPIVLFIQEQLPLRDAVGVTDHGRHRHFLRCAGNVEQLQAGLMREAVGLALVHVPGGPDEVFPSVSTTTRAGHDVVEVALGRVQQAAGVLAAVTVALTDVLGAELRALLGHLGEVHGHDDRRHTDGAARSPDSIIALTHRQRDPLRPTHRPERFRAGAITLNVQRRRRVRCHLAERIRRRADIDRLPIPVQHQNNVLVQHVIHKSICIRLRRFAR